MHNSENNIRNFLNFLNNPTDKKEVAGKIRKFKIENGVFIIFSGLFMGFFVYYFISLLIKTGEVNVFQVSCLVILFLFALFAVIHGFAKLFKKININILEQELNEKFKNKDLVFLKDFEEIKINLKIFIVYFITVSVLFFYAMFNFSSLL